MTAPLTPRPEVRHRLAAAIRFEDAFTGQPVPARLDVRAETLPILAGMPLLPWRALRAGDGTYRFLVSRNTAMPAGGIPITVTAPDGEYQNFEPFTLNLPRPIAGPLVTRADFLVRRTIWPTRRLHLPPGETGVIGRIVDAAGVPVAGLRVRMAEAAGPIAPTVPYTYSAADGTFLMRFPGLLASTGTPPTGSPQHGAGRHRVGPSAGHGGRAGRPPGRSRSPSAKLTATAHHGPIGGLMPEYLSPGVFIEEIPARLKAIEGVSTSTAGFVRRGRSAARSSAGCRRWGRRERLPAHTRRGAGPRDQLRRVPARRSAHRRPTCPQTAIWPLVRALLRQRRPPRVHLPRHARRCPGLDIPIDQGGVRAAHPGHPADRHRSLPQLASRPGHGRHIRPGAAGRDGHPGPDCHRGVHTRRPASITVAAGTFAALPAPLEPGRAAVLLTASAPERRRRAHVLRPLSGRSGATRCACVVVCADRPPVAVAAAIPAAGSNIVDLQTSAAFYTGAAVEVDDGAGTKVVRTVRPRCSRATGSASTTPSPASRVPPAR